MSDFSGPNPADVPDDGPFTGDAPGDDADDSVIYDDDAEGVVAGGDVDCRNCVHKRVCSLFGGIAPMLQDYAADESVQGEEPPIDPTDLAVICDEFEPVEGE